MSLAEMFGLRFWKRVCNHAFQIVDGRDALRWVVAEVVDVDALLHQFRDAVDGVGRIKHLTGADVQPPLAHPFLVHRSVRAFHRLLQHPAVGIYEETALHRVRRQPIHGHIGEREEVVTAGEVHATEHVPPLAPLLVDKLAIVDAPALGLLKQADAVAGDPLRHASRSNTH